MSDSQERLVSACSNCCAADASCSTERKSSPHSFLRVGCALLPKKVSRYLTPKMISTAHRRGLELVTIDIEKNLSEQGHFDAIIHKLRPNTEWEQNLHNYTLLNPSVKVIDKVSSIRNLQNRSTMLRPLQGDGVHVLNPAYRQSPSVNHHHNQQGNAPNPGKVSHSLSSAGPVEAVVQAPPQVELPEGCTVEAAAALLREQGLYPPLLVKSVWTDGRKGSHGLAILHDLNALGDLLDGKVSSELKLPLVLQQFVDHGGVIYKVYVLGSRVVTCRRPSLGPRHLDQAAQLKGVISVPRISCKSHYASNSVEARFSAGVVHVGSDQGGVMAGGGGAVGTGGAGWVKLGNGASSSSPLSPCQCILKAKVGDGSGDGSGDRNGDRNGDNSKNTSNDRCSNSHAKANLVPLTPSTPPPVTPLASSSPTPTTGAANTANTATTTSSPTPSSPPPLLPGMAADVPCPPNWVTVGLASALRHRLGMQLFNFDMICSVPNSTLPKSNGVGAEHGEGEAEEQGAEGVRVGEDEGTFESPRVGGGGKRRKVGEGEGKEEGEGGEEKRTAGERTCGEINGNSHVLDCLQRSHGYCLENGEETRKPNPNHLVAGRSPTESPQRPATVNDQPTSLGDDLGLFGRSSRGEFFLHLSAADCDRGEGEGEGEAKRNRDGSAGGSGTDGTDDEILDPERQVSSSSGEEVVSATVADTDLFLEAESAHTRGRSEGGSGGGAASKEEGMTHAPSMAHAPSATSAASTSATAPGKYYVIDINYFPGVDKIPDFESMFCDFLLAACQAGKAGAMASMATPAAGKSSGR